MEISFVGIINMIHRKERKGKLKYRQKDERQNRVSATDTT
jgi:hypothetical protein